VLVDINDAAIQAAYPEAGERRLRIAANLADAASVLNAADTAMAKLRRIDVLCSIAGGFRLGPPMHGDAPRDVATDEGHEYRIRAQRSACGRAAQAAGRIGKDRQRRCRCRAEGAPQHGAYGAAHSVVIRLTESMAGELREQAISLNWVIPSLIDAAQNRAAMPDADPRRW
jgi:NAD(P)-dependent dehydrogenase (short-subunit alcohol dehydrogenase family)